MSKKNNASKFDKKVVNRLLSYLLKYKIQFIFVIICIIISAITQVTSSLFLKVLIDNYISPLLLTNNPVFTGLFTALTFMAGIYLIGVLSNLTYSRIMAKLSASVLRDIRDEMFEHMQTLPIKYFDTNTHGDIMSRFTNDTDTLRQMISQSIPQVLSSIVTVISIFIAMLSTSLWLTLIVVVALFIMLKLIGIIASKSGKFFVKQQKSLGDINGFIEEIVNGQRVVKVFCHEDAIEKTFNIKNEELRLNATKANTYANILMPLMNNFGYLIYVVVAIVGGALAISGVTNISLIGINVLSLGMIASFLQLTRNFINPIAQVSQQLNAVVMALSGASRIFNLLDEKSEADEGYVTLVNARYTDDNELVECEQETGTWAFKHPHKASNTTTYEKVCGEVVFENVDFSYDGKKKILKDISLYAKPGQKIALVGATGAGKTTITNLINRFYDIDSGKIRYDGINISKIKKEDLRRSLGVVLQDVEIFTDTVLENIRYGKLTATDEECIEAAKLANADTFIDLLPDGYNTILTGDGAGLSQGQRQLLSIARAAVADPPVMILDEATSSIDTRTERIVQSGMDSLMYGRTVFVIAHRLSTIKNSDVIMVLDSGEIIERGNHEELLAKKGTYYRLYTGAFEME